MNDLTKYQIESLSNQKYPLEFSCRHTPHGLHCAARDYKRKKMTEIEIGNELIEKMGTAEACFYFFNQAIKAFNAESSS